MSTKKKTRGGPASAAPAPTEQAGVSFPALAAQHVASNSATTIDKPSSARASAPSAEATAATSFPPVASAVAAPASSAHPSVQVGFRVVEGHGDGVRVSEVISGSVASSSGLRSGDVVQGISGTAVFTRADFDAALSARLEAGRSILIKVLRDSRSCVVVVPAAAAAAPTRKPDDSEESKQATPHTARDAPTTTATVTRVGSQTARGAPKKKPAARAPPSTVTTAAPAAAAEEKQQAAEPPSQAQPTLTSPRSKKISATVASASTTPAPAPASIPDAAPAAATAAPQAALTKPAPPSKATTAAAAAAMQSPAADPSATATAAPKKASADDASPVVAAAVPVASKPTLKVVPAGSRPAAFEGQEHEVEEEGFEGAETIKTTTSTNSQESNDDAAAGTAPVESTTAADAPTSAPAPATKSTKKPAAPAKPAARQPAAAVKPAPPSSKPSPATLQSPRQAKGVIAASTTSGTDKPVAATATPSTKPTATEPAVAPIAPIPIDSTSPTVAPTAAVAVASPRSSAKAAEPTSPSASAPTTARAAANKKKTHSSAAAVTASSAPTATNANTQEAVAATTTTTTVAETAAAAGSPKSPIRSTKKKVPAATVAALPKSPEPAPAPVDENAPVDLNESIEEDAAAEADVAPVLSPPLSPRSPLSVATTTTSTKNTTRSPRVGGAQAKKKDPVPSDPTAALVAVVAAARVTEPSFTKQARPGATDLVVSASSTAVTPRVKKAKPLVSPPADTEYFKSAFLVLPDEKGKPIAANTKTDSNKKTKPTSVTTATTTTSKSNKTTPKTTQRTVNEKSEDTTTPAAAASTEPSPNTLKRGLVQRITSDEDETPEPASAVASVATSSSAAAPAQSKPKPTVTRVEVTPKSGAATTSSSWKDLPPDDELPRLVTIDIFASLSQSGGALAPSPKERGSFATLRGAGGPESPADPETLRLQRAERDAQVAFIRQQRRRSVELAAGDATDLLLLAEQQRREEEERRRANAEALVVLQARKDEVDAARARLKQAKRYIGIEIVDAPAATTNANGSSATSAGALRDGVKIVEVKSGGSAEAAGLVVGDVILAVNGVETHTRSQFGRALRAVEVGARVPVLVRSAAPPQTAAVAAGSSPTSVSTKKKSTKKKVVDSTRTVELEVASSDLNVEEIASLHTTLLDEARVHAEFAQLKSRTLENTSERVQHAAVILAEAEASVFVAETSQKIELAQLERAAAGEDQTPVAYDLGPNPLDRWKKLRNKVYLGLEIVDVAERKLAPNVRSATVAAAASSAESNGGANASGGGGAGSAIGGAMRTSKVFPGDAADRAGVREGDLIIMVNGRVTCARVDLERILRGTAVGVAKSKPLQPGDFIDLVVLRSEEAPSTTTKKKTPRGIVGAALVPAASAMRQLELRLQVGAVGVPLPEVLALRAKAESMLSARAQLEEHQKRLADAALLRERKAARLRAASNPPSKEPSKEGEADAANDTSSAEETADGDATASTTESSSSSSSSSSASSSSSSRPASVSRRSSVKGSTGLIRSTSATPRRRRLAGRMHKPRPSVVLESIELETESAAASENENDADDDAQPPPPPPENIAEEEEEA